MFDINFYMKISDLKTRLMKDEKFDKQYLFEQFEKLRSAEPILYNFETTNACNMTCKMCPRTRLMTRKIETINNSIFEKVIDQLKPFSDKDWQKWQDFVESYYQIPRDEVSENHFLRHILPKVIVMHGYGEPLLDKNIAEKIKMLSDRNLPSYFSCNPANINIEKLLPVFENGLDYIKFAIDTVDDSQHKKIRGRASSFTEGYNKILQLLKLKEMHGYKTVIIITMINFDKSWEENEFSKLKKKFEDMNVYLYLKSYDQFWAVDYQQKTKAISWIEFCHFPWTSLTVKSNGEVAMCVEDFNNEIILGHADKETLHSIWNGEKYERFRKAHFDLKENMKCTRQCDMKLIGNMNLSGKLLNI